MADVSIEHRCQAAIAEEFAGEQPVGSCLLVPAPATDVFDWMAYIPTMRVPEDVTGTANAYLSFRALLVAVLNYNKANI